MEERRGTHLTEKVTCLANWYFSLLPYFVATSMIFAKVVLGWTDAPFWRVWYPVFLLSVMGRYADYLLQYAYGWYKKRSGFSITIDVLAAIATLLYPLLEDMTVSWWWRCYIIATWIVGEILAVWLFKRVATDFENWWRSSDGEVPSQSFCEYVRELNVASGIEADNSNAECR